MQQEEPKLPNARIKVNRFVVSLVGAQFSDPKFDEENPHFIHPTSLVNFSLQFLFLCKRIFILQRKTTTKM